MLVRLYSDLHLEWGKYKISKLPNDSETILVLAGDIGERGKPREFIERACKQFKAVVYVMGNHEYYNGEYYEVNHYWKDRQAENENLYVLHNETVFFDNVRIIGATMWTDLNKGEWVSMYEAKKCMNDFHIISVNEESKAKRISRKGKPHGVAFSPEFHCQLHKEAVEFIESELQKDWDGVTIVTTHHSPSPTFVEDVYKDSLLNPAFHANADYLFENYKVDYWFYGHTHHSANRVVADTHFLANPRGYQGYENSKELGFDDNFWIEV